MKWDRWSSLLFNLGINSFLLSFLRRARVVCIVLKKKEKNLLICKKCKVLITFNFDKLKSSDGWEYGVFYLSLK